MEEKQIKKLFISLFIVVIFTFFSAQAKLATAHEVYVLSSHQISEAVATHSFNLINVAKDNLILFITWGLIAICLIALVFLLSLLQPLRRFLNQLYKKTRPYAPFVARVTVGLSFLAAAYYQATYGPELPLRAAYGSLTPVITTVLVIIGLMIIVGWFARIAAAVALLMYAFAVYKHGWYMLTYVNYLGEIIVLLVLGAHNLSLDHLFAKFKKNQLAAGSPSWLARLQAWLAPRSFAILRICFGISLIVASAYAKVIYNNLGLFTVVKYHLDTILGFEPHFLVLGAAIIEIMIGTFIIFGFELQFTSLFFEFWLMMSLWFFGEVVWPHLILIGIPIALVMYGYDNYSVAGRLFKDEELKPVL